MKNYIGGNEETVWQDVDLNKSENLNKMQGLLEGFEPQQKTKDLLQYKKYRRKIENSFVDQFPEYAKLKANAPIEYNKRRAYADSLAQDPKYSKMYLENYDNTGLSSDEVSEFIKLREGLSDIISGGTNTKGTGTKSDKFGLRNALLNPKAIGSKLQEKEYNINFDFNIDDLGNISKKIKNAQVDKINNDYLMKSLGYKKGGSINYIVEWRP